MEADESKKETLRVLEGSEKSASGRAKYHKSLENAIEKIAAGAKTRFLNEPFSQFYDEMENQIFEDFK